MTWRYEIKFILDEGRMSRLVAWLGSTRFITRPFPARRVNSLYWDTADMRAARENLDGLAERRKYRCRWYGSSNDAEVVFETKIRNGRLGRKVTHSMAGTAEGLPEHPRWSDTLLVNDSSTPNGAPDALPDAPLVPVLGVSYSREYLIWRDKVRLTVDRDMSYRDVAGRQVVSIKDSNAAILEVKFPPEEKDLALSLIATAPFYPLRHSKYLRGLNLVGRAVYV